jgi:putative chitinase
MSFDFDFTPEKLSKCVNNPYMEHWFDPLTNVLPNYDITTVPRVAAWLAQISHESGDFKFVEENLNYGAKGLRSVFPTHFSTDEIAETYQRQPERIANRIYANRMGNGDESSGEGYKFRGRGLVQVTGKSNYAACSKALYGDENTLLENPDLLKEADGAIRSACWYWNSRNLNASADAGDMLTITKRINGGTIGLEDRLERYRHIISVLNG